MERPSHDCATSGLTARSCLNWPPTGITNPGLILLPHMVCPRNAGKTHGCSEVSGQDAAVARHMYLALSLQ